VHGQKLQQAGLYLLSLLLQLRLLLAQTLQLLHSSLQLCHALRGMLHLCSLLLQLGDLLVQLGQPLHLLAEIHSLLLDSLHLLPSALQQLLLGLRGAERELLSVCIKPPRHEAATAEAADPGVAFRLLASLRPHLQLLQLLLHLVRAPQLLLQLCAPPSGLLHLLHLLLQLREVLHHSRAVSRLSHQQIHPAVKILQLRLLLQQLGQLRDRAAQLLDARPQVLGLSSSSSKGSDQDSAQANARPSLQFVLWAVRQAGRRSGSEQ
jgi:hypothetical protein